MSKNDKNLGTLYYAAFVPHPDHSGRMLRRGMATTSVSDSQTNGKQLYTVKSDIGALFIGTEEDIFSKPYGGEEILYAFGKDKDKPILLLRKFLADEQDKIENRLSEIEHERDALDMTCEWANAAKEKALGTE